jgi:hypothetical protein
MTIHKVRDLHMQDIVTELPRQVKDVKYRKATDIEQIVVHHSLTHRGTPLAFAQYHVLTRGWSMIGYGYVIQKDGTIYRTGRDIEVTPHVGRYNHTSLGICLVGDFRSEEPTPEQRTSLYALLVALRLLYPWVKDIKGHSELHGYEWKACPIISMDEVRSNVFEMEKPTPEERKKAINEIVYHKKKWKEGHDTKNNGLMEWAHHEAKQWYNRLTVDEAAILRGMNYEEAVEYYQSVKLDIAKLIQS